MVSDILSKLLLMYVVLSAIITLYKPHKYVTGTITFSITHVRAIFEISAVWICVHQYCSYELFLTTLLCYNDNGYTHPPEHTYAVISCPFITCMFRADSGGHADTNAFRNEQNISIIHI